MCPLENPKLYKYLNSYMACILYLMKTKEKKDIRKKLYIKR